MQQSYTNHAFKSTHDFLVTSSLIKYIIWYQVASFHVHITMGWESEAQDTNGKHINNATTAVTISAQSSTVSDLLLLCFCYH
jgi:hypothetical protein